MLLQVTPQICLLSDQRSVFLSFILNSLLDMTTFYNTMDDVSVNVIKFRILEDQV